jgi:hypothetical protein
VPLGRLETFARLGRVGIATSMFERAADRALEEEWRNRLQRAPHGEPWYSSLHVSEFPGDDPRWCPRALLYSLMGHPPVEPASRDLMGTAKVGQAVEDWNLEYVDLDGRLLSAPPGAKRQTGFEDADHWLTGSPDFVVLPPFTNRPHLIETKTKDREVIIAMKMLQRSYDPGHARQARGYLGIGNKVAHVAWPEVVVCKHTWRLALPGSEDVVDAMFCRDHGDQNDCLTRVELQPMTTASLIYFARERPGQRQMQVEYLFEHDEAWFQTGLARLAQVREHLLADELPPHPFGGKEWSKQPCSWCKLKKHSCKPDHAAGVTRLTESKGGEFAADVYRWFDSERVRQAVIDRWVGKGGMRVKTHDDDSDIHKEERS